MDNDRFAALEKDLNREFGKSGHWHRFFTDFQAWIERRAAGISQRLGIRQPGFSGV